MERRHFLLAGSGLLATFLTGCGGGDDSGSLLQPLTRKNITSLSQSERQKFIETLYAMKKVPSLYDPSTNAYDYFVDIHVEAFNGHTNAHMCAAFLPWHREMLLRFEKEMRRVSGDPFMTMSYWDWHDPGAHEKIFTNDFLGGNGDPENKWYVTTGAFRKDVWAMGAVFDETPDEFADTDGDGSPDAPPFILGRNGLTRRYSFGGELQPDLKFLDTYMARTPLNKLMAISSYDAAPYMETMATATERAIGYDAMNAVSMRKYLERLLHNTVHACIGGQMGAGSSPNDPTFFLHHTNVDRLWALWQQKYGNDGYPTATQSPMTGIDAKLDIYETSVLVQSTFDLKAHSGVQYR